MTEMLNTLAGRLTIAMIAARMTQVELASQCGVKPPSVSGWLSGKSKFMRGENLLFAAKALGVSPLWLATGQGPRTPNEEDQAMYALMATPTASEWPFDRITPEQYFELSKSDRDYLEGIVSNEIKSTLANKKRAIPPSKLAS